MRKAFKNFGMGLVYILILPIIVCATVLMGIYGILQNIIYLFKGVVRFFKGETFFKPLREDREVKYILKYNEVAARNAAKEEPTPVQENISNSNTTYIQNNYYSSKEETPNPQIDQKQNAAVNMNPGIENHQPQQQLPHENPVYIENKDMYEERVMPKAIETQPRETIIDVDSTPKRSVDDITSNQELMDYLNEDPFFITTDNDDGGINL